MQISNFFRLRISYFRPLNLGDESVSLESVTREDGTWNLSESSSFHP